MIPSHYVENVPILPLPQPEVNDVGSFEAALVRQSWELYRKIHIHEDRGVVKRHVSCGFVAGAVDRFAPSGVGSLLARAS
jgi:hypothetical protein